MSFDDVSVSLFWRWIDSVEVEPLVASSFQPEFQNAGAEHYFDLTARYDVTDFFRLTVGVNNLLNNKPPFTGSSIGATGFNSGNTFPSTYDVLGRRYSATARFQF
jgi:outer membrane receptor protein involved in Fe transport